MRPHVLSQRQRVDSGYVEWDDTPSFANSCPNA